MRSPRWLALTVLFAVAACVKTVTPAPRSIAPAHVAVVSTIGLDALGLRIDVPGGAGVAAGDRPGSLVVTSASGWRLTVDEGSPADTLAVALAAAARLDARDVETQETDDGHWMTFERTGLIGETHGLQLVRRLGTRVYRCEALVARRDEARAALAACKTLRR